MMDYEIFRDVVKEKFLSYMPGKYQDMEVKVVPVKKVNRKLDGLSLWKAGGGHCLILSSSQYHILFNRFARTPQGCF